MKFRKQIAVVMTAVSLVFSGTAPAMAASAGNVIITNETNLATKKKVYKSGSSYYGTKSNGKTYKLSGVEVKAAKRLLKSSINLSLKKAFKWSAMPFFATPDPTTTDSKKIAEYYGNFGFDNHKGSCDVQAYTFYYMAKILGNNVKVIRGYVMKTTGLSEHSWCEITDKDGNVKVYDPNFNSEYSKSLGNNYAGYGFKYGASKTLQYYDANKKRKK